MKIRNFVLWALVTSSTAMAAPISINPQQLTPTSPSALQGVLEAALSPETQQAMLANAEKKITLAKHQPTTMATMGTLPAPLPAPPDSPPAVVPTASTAPVVKPPSAQGEAWLLPHLRQTITPMARVPKPYRVLPASAVYGQRHGNIISDTDGNALLSRIPITQVAPQPGTVRIVKWIDNTQGQHIGIVFSVIAPKRKTVQMMVMLKGDHPAVSLVFTVSHVHGRVVQLPVSLTGVAPLQTSPVFGQPSVYDARVIALMQQVLSHQPLGNTWDYTVRYHPLSPYHEFRVKRHQRWRNRQYAIDAFVLCSRYARRLSLRASTFANANTIAVTLTHNLVAKGACTRLVIIGQRHHASQKRAVARLAPAEEQPHV